MPGVLGQAAFQAGGVGQVNVFPGVVRDFVGGLHGALVVAVEAPGLVEAGDGGFGGCAGDQ